MQDQQFPSSDLSTHRPRTRLSRRRRGLVLVATAIGALAIGAGVALVASGESVPRVQADPIATVPTASSARDAAVLQRESAGAQGGAPEQTQGGGAPEQTQDGGTAEEPQPQPEPPAAPGELEVSKTNIVLPDGVYMGSFTVSNVGGSSLEWTWSPGGFGISASPNAGTLAPGESVVVSFEVNPFAIPEGAFAYAASINSDAGSKHVTITGYREAIAVNPDLDLPDLDLTNDDGM